MSFNILYSIARSLIRTYSRLLLRLDVHWHGHPPMGVLITAKAISFPLFGFYLRHAGRSR